ncbi:MAG TPA: hypothetical protein VGN54_07660 [Mycobacteriales bacterium]|nr:hypothetical protein [Mycobacteriales bacterium]
MRFTLSSGRPSTTRPRHWRWSRRLTALAIALPLATTGAIVAGELAASAHTTGVSGTATCDASTGTYSVHWVGTTTSVPAGVTADVTYTSPGSSTPVKVVDNLAANQGYAFDQTAIPGSVTSVSVTVSAVWTDGVKSSATGTASGVTGCTQTRHSLPVAPTLTVSSCGVGGSGFAGSSYTVPNTPGVDYTPTPGNYQLAAGQSATVTAVPDTDDNYVFSTTAQSQTFTVTAPADAVCTLPAAPLDSIAIGCGTAQVFLSNGPAPAAHFTGTPITLIIKVTGEPDRSVTLQPGDTKTENYTFADDTGVRHVQVFQGATALDKGADVSSDCGVDSGPALTLTTQCTTSTSSDNWTVTTASTTPVAFKAVSANGLTTFTTGTVVAGTPALFMTPSSFTGNVLLMDADSAGVFQPASSAVAASSALCSQPTPVTPTVAVSCKNGNTKVTFTNPAGSTLPALFTVTDNGTMPAGGSVLVAPGLSNSVTLPTKNADLLGYSYAYQATGAGSGGYPTTAFATTLKVNCPLPTKVEGNTFTKTPPKTTTPPTTVTTPPAALPTQVLGTTVTKSAGTLPFTGGHTVILLDFALALFGGGAALWLLSRRRRVS